jgi:UDP-glucose 4-epimerase
MKIAVIGGAGYIGSHVARLFAAKGYLVTVIDNLSPGTEENLFPEYAFYNGDILDYPWLVSVLRQGIDGIVHLVASKAAGESMIKPEKYATQNIAGTINILNAACESKIPIIVFSSSAAVYGEPHYLPIDEAHPKEPSNFYGFTKLEIERLLAWYDTLKGIKFAALRYFNAAGADPSGALGERHAPDANLVPVIMEVAAGIRPNLEIFGTDYPTPDGSGVRDYIHVSDLAVAHLLAFERLLESQRSFAVNLGSEQWLSDLEILDAARRITGHAIPANIRGRRAGDPAKLIASSAIAHQLLRWKAMYSDVDTIIATSWQAYKRHFRQENE